MSNFKSTSHHVWKQRGWERGDKVHQGGAQAHTHYARKATDPPGEFNYVLKSLARQDDIVRRGMFSAEANLQISHPGVAQIVDTNAGEHLDPVDLFIVTERIKGIDLEQIVKIAPLTVADAAKVVAATLRIIGHCHAVGVIHRDIKPCHVILRNGDLSDPVLIHFGLAYHDDRPAEAKTQDGEGRGNRFLFAPEQHGTTAAANQSAATDICQCVGLLFFAITGQYPRVLIDAQNKKPHERDGIRLFDGLPPWKQRALGHLFGVGFEWNPLQRWTDASALADQVNALTQSDEPAIDDSLDAEIFAILDKVGNSMTARYKAAAEMSLPLVEMIRSLANAIGAKTVETLTLTLSKHVESATQTQGLIVNFTNKFVVGKTHGVRFRFTVEGTELVAKIMGYNGSVSLLEGEHEREVARYSLGSTEAVNDLKPIAKKWLLACVSEALGVED